MTRYFSLLLLLMGIPVCWLVGAPCRADAIHDAVNQGDLQAVKRLLAEDPGRLNARQPWGDTPLICAASHGQLEIARLLIDAGADVNLAMPDGWNPLHTAVADGDDDAHVKIARLLLQHGAATDATNGAGLTPLLAAALRGNRATLQLLLDQGISFAVTDNTGATALHLAAEEGHLGVVRMLLAKGADRTARDKEGRTPIDRALRHSRMDAIGALLADKHVTLHIEGAGVADAIQKLLDEANVSCAVQSAVAAGITLRLTDVSFPQALIAVVAAVGSPLDYRYQDGKLIVTRAAKQMGSPADEVITADSRFKFFKTISRQVLCNYLSRAVTHYGLCSTSPEPSTPYFEDDLRMLTGMGAKFIGRAAYAWVPPDDEEAHFRLAAERAQRVHAADPEIILQAAVFEAVYEKVSRIPVPDWVFKEFGLPVDRRGFRYGALLYDGSKFHDQWASGGSIPDMSKLETRMYFYYRARRYIDAGFEAIHFGQVGLMDNNDPDHRYWLDLLTRVRRYASEHARRRMVLCDAHTHGITVGDHLLFDFHAWPLMAGDVVSSPQRVALAVGYHNSIYGLSEGGITPSGWECDRLPYICEIDGGGSSDKPGQPVGFPWNWGYDCASWFAHQDARYRAQFLAYAHNWLRDLHEDASLQMPTRLNLAIGVEGHRMWQGNTRSSACPEGFDEENVIRSIWEGEASGVGRK